MTRIKAGYGYWDCTHYPIGGNFQRAGADGLSMIEIEHLKPPFPHGCTAIGWTEDGRKIAFQMSHTEGYNITSDTRIHI